MYTQQQYLSKKVIFVAMKGNSILFIKETFETTPAESCHLLIKLGADSFSYAIIGNNEVLVLYDEQNCPNVAAKLDEKLKNDEHLTHTYQSVKIAIQTRNVVNIPKNLLSHQNLASHCKYFVNDDFDQVYVRHTEKMATLFAPSYNTNKLIISYLANAEIFDTNTPLITQAKIHKQQLFIDFSATCVNIILTKDGQLIFHNSFEIENSEELNYYLLLLIHQLPIDTEQTQLCLSGLIHEDDDNLTVCQSLFAQVSFNKINQLNISILDDLPLHYYTSLLALHQCA